MRALSIRQPYAEEILRGLKTVEYRPARTTLLDEVFYIYAGAKPGSVERFRALGVEPGTLPTGVIVGTAKITKCVAIDPRSNPLADVRRGGTGSVSENYEWHLADVKRLDKPIKPKRHPQPSWFNPF